MKDKLKVDFWPRQVVILVEHPTGVIYQAQAGGYACLHPEAEGYIQFTDILSRNLEERFDDGYGGHCYNGITKADADMVDDLLDRYFLKEWRVDREKLKEAYEAWIPLKRGREKGYLCWENSD